MQDRAANSRISEILPSSSAADFQAKLRSRIRGNFQPLSTHRGSCCSAIFDGLDHHSLIQTKRLIKASLPSVESANLNEAIQGAWVLRNPCYFALMA
jgi:hypothetical protein